MASSAPEPQPQGKAGGVPASESPQSLSGEMSAHLASGLPLPSVPDHELLRCVGRGAYGAVWLARNVMGAYRAVKIVHGEDFTRERPFTREYEGLLNFEPISRSHPNLMQILHVGRRDSYFYYVTELADDANADGDLARAPPAGRATPVERPAASDAQQPPPAAPADLPQSANRDVPGYVPRTLQADLGRRGRLPTRECLRVAVALASALKHLHDHKLVHRDVKPSNVIFVHGVPKLSDIGLVAAAGDSHSIVGTEGYLPPEGPGSAQADLYSLGKMLYEISTGMGRGDYPRLPQNLRELPDAKELLEFNEVLLRACARDTERRYHSAEELLADLALLERGNSVKRLHRLERHHVLLRRVGVGLLVVGLLISAAWWETWRAHRIANRHLARLHVYEGTQRMVQGDYAGALPWLVGALQLDSGSAERERAHRLRIARVLESCPLPAAHFSVAESKVTAADLNPDGTLLATAHNDGWVRLWNTRTGEPIPPLPHKHPVAFCQFLPSGDRLLTLTLDQKAWLWDLARPESAPQTFTQGMPALSDGLYSVGLNEKLGRAYLSKAWYCFARTHPLTNTFQNLTLTLKLVGKGDDLLVKYEFRRTIPDGAVVHEGEFLDTPNADRFDDGRDQPAAPLWGRVYLLLENGSWGDSPGESGQVIWDNVRTRRHPTGKSPPPPWEVLDDFTADTSVTWFHVALPGQRGSCRVENGQLVVACEQLPRTQTASGTVSRLDSFEISRTHTLEIAVDLVSVRAANRMVGLTLCRYAYDPRSARDRPFIAHGRWLATTWCDGPTRIWDLLQPQSDRTQEQGPYAPLELDRTGIPLDLDFSPDTNYVAVVEPRDYASSEPEGTLALFNLRTGLAVAASSVGGASLTGARFSPDNRFLAVSRGAGLMLLGTTDWQLAHTLATGASFEQPRFSPRGCRLAAVREGRELVVWDLTNLPEPAATFPRQTDIKHIAFSPDGRYVVSCSGNEVVQVWDVIQGEPFGPPLPGVQARFSADGVQLLTISGEGGVWLWDLSRISGETLAVPALRTGQRFASTSRESMTAEIEGQAVTLSTPTDQSTLFHPVPLRGVAFTRDEQYLISESLDGRAWSWDIRSRMLAGPPRPVRYDVALTDFSCPDLVPDERDRHALSDLAALLGRQRPDGAGGMSPVEEVERARLLAEWKQAPRARFGADEMSEMRWHRGQAAAAELAMDWDAAVFHWERALDGKSEIQNPKPEIPVESRLAYARRVADDLRQAILEGRSRWSIILPRQPWATPDMVDLGRFAMLPLAETLAKENEALFRKLPAGVQTLGGIRFDVRGYIYLNRTKPVVIPLDRACKRLHFLHAASQPPSWNREFAGTYQVTYAKGATAAVRLGNPEDIGPHAPHRFYAVSPAVRTNATGELRSALFWSGQAPGPGERRQPVYLTGTTWELPAEHRGEVVETLELQADTAESVPLVFAITVEPFE